MRLIKSSQIKLKDILKSELVLRILKAASWSLTGVASAKFLLLVLGIMTANILGKIQYGELGIIRSSVNMFAVLATMGFGMTGSKFLSQYRSTDKVSAGNVLSVINLFSIVISSTFAITVFLTAEWIASYTINAPHLKNGIQIGALLIFFSSINAGQNGILSGLEKFRSIAVNKFFASIFEFIFVVIGAYYFSVNGAIFGAGLGFLILYLLNHFSVKKGLLENKISPNFCNLRKKDFSIIWNFSIPAAISSFLVVPVLWYNKALLVRIGGFEQMALFEVAEQWRILMLFVPSSLSQILLPIITSLKHTEETKNYRKVLWYAIGTNILITGFLFILIFIFKQVILATYGNDFNDYRPLIILAFSTIFSSVATVIGQAIASSSKMWIGFTFNLIWAIIFTSFSYLLVFRFEASIAISLALFFSYLFHTIFQGIYFWKRLV